MSNVLVVRPSELGFLRIKFSDEELLSVKEEINNIKNNFDSSGRANSMLAGNLTHEYKLPKSRTQLNTLFQPYIKEYKETFKIELENLRLVDPWVNFQQKYEFNPMHVHDGVLSFVLWTSIPYLMETEMKQKHSVDSISPVPGCFTFTYANLFGQICEYVIPADKKYENYALLFPSNLNHSVYPFYTSDDYRISVSGNFHVE